MSTRVPLTALGGALFVAAPIALLVTGHTAIVTSSDEGADARPLWVAIVPVVAGLLLARLVPPRLPVAELASTVDRPALVRQIVALAGLAAAFPALVSVLGSGTGWYPLLKVALFLGGGLLVTRMMRGSLPPRPDVAAVWRWAGGIPAVLAWGLLTFWTPVNLDVYRDMDPVYLWGAAALTFLTASLLEEYFYRVLLQTRIEAVAGRWTAIVATSLLFAAMHLPSHLRADEPWVAVAAILTFQGLFGVFTGYLWSRYRNVWIVFAVHTAVNLVSLLPLAFE